MSHKPAKVGIWGNTEKLAFWDLLPKIGSWTQKNGMEIFLTTRIIAKAGSDIDFDHTIIKSANDFNQ